MKKFNYTKATSLEDASAQIKADKHNHIMAGGTDLLGTLKADIMPEPVNEVISIKDISGMAGIRKEDGIITIGATTTLAEIEKSSVVNLNLPILAEAAHSVATPLIRNMGTIGGNICQDVRCWYYRYPHEGGDRLVCARKGGKQCYAPQGDNRYHSVFGGMRIGVSACTKECPASTNIPGYMEKLRAGDWEGAARIIMQVNPMPMLTSRVCPHPCQSACNQCEHGDCVNIHCVERSVGDYILENTEKFYKAPEMETGKTVAIIGAGPSGLTAAYYLRKQGHAVTVYDKMEEPGGVLMYGIPHYRLPKDIIRQFTKALRNMGIQFVMNTEIGKDITVEQIEEKYDTMYLGTGAWKQPILGIEGENLTQFGLNFLVEVNKYLAGKVGKEVLVCGGGNVAMDVALTAKRLGVEKVTLVCLEQRYEMPASAEEIARAEEEGVKIINGRGLSRVMLDENGQVKGMETNQCISVRDEAGRFNPLYNNDDKMEIASDCIILATGQRVDIDFLGDTFRDQIKSERGLIEVGEGNETRREGVYAGGDAATGPNIAIRAIRTGGNAARNMSAYLGCPMETVKRETAFITHDTEGIKVRECNKQEELPVEKRTLTAEDESSYPEGVALEEAKRCMNCGCYAVTPSDIVPALIALNATIVTNQRKVTVEEFACSRLRVCDALQEGEIIIQIEIPENVGTVMHYDKFRLRKSVDFAVAGLASVIGVEQGKITSARFVFGGVAPIPIVATEVMEYLLGKEVREDVAKTAAEIAVKNVFLLKDNAYKAEIMKSLVKDAVLRMR